MLLRDFHNMTKKEVEENATIFCRDKIKGYDILFGILPHGENYVRAAMVYDGDTHLYNLDCVEYPHDRLSRYQKYLSDKELFNRYKQRLTNTLFLEEEYDEPPRSFTEYRHKLTFAKNYPLPFQQGWMLEQLEQQKRKLERTDFNFSKDSFLQGFFNASNCFRQLYESVITQDPLISPNDCKTVSDTLLNSNLNNIQKGAFVKAVEILENLCRNS